VNDTTGYLKENNTILLLQERFQREDLHSNSWKFGLYNCMDQCQPKLLHFHTRSLEKVNKLSFRCIEPLSHDNQLWDSQRNKLWC